MDDRQSLRLDAYFPQIIDSTKSLLETSFPIAELFVGFLESVYAYSNCVQSCIRYFLCKFFCNQRSV